MEFEVPRLGSRIDAVVIAGPAALLIEFKCGAREFHRADFEQVWDYALDLKNFHQGSHRAPILPILVATEAAATTERWGPPELDSVWKPLKCNGTGLAQALRSGLQHTTGPTLDPNQWGSAPYHPTPTIIEAARALYARHSVEAISRHDAGATNLRETSVCVEDVIERAQQQRQKAIVFLTGVPGPERH
jgi:hypothetical protein